MIWLTVDVEWCSFFAYFTTEKFLLATAAALDPNKYFYDIKISELGLIVIFEGVRAYESFQSSANDAETCMTDTHRRDIS